MELYNLMDMELEQSLLLRADDDDENNNDRHNDSNDKSLSNKKKNHSAKHYGLSTYAISTNRQYLGFSRGIGKVTIYLMESGLEIASKDFGEDTKIILMELFTDDEQALIITQAKNDPVAVINIWNLFYDCYDD